MSLAGLLAAALLALPAAPTGAAPAAPEAGPPYYRRPAEPAADLARLRAEIAAGRVDALEWHRQVKLYLALGELAEIDELAALLATTFPDDPAFLEARMMFLSLADQDAAAKALGEDLLRRFPDYPTIRANLGRVYLEAGDRARGVNLLIAALESGPIRVEDWSLLLEGLGLAGKDAAADPEKVLVTLRGKVAASPERAGLRYLLVVALTRLGHYEEARRELTAHPGLAEHPEIQVFLAHGAEQPAALAGRKD